MRCSLGESHVTGRLGRATRKASTGILVDVVNPSLNPLNVCHSLTNKYGVEACDEVAESSGDAVEVARCVVVVAVYGDGGRCLGNGVVGHAR